MREGGENARLGFAGVAPGAAMDIAGSGLGEACLIDRKVMICSCISLECSGEFKQREAEQMLKLTLSNLLMDHVCRRDEGVRCQGYFYWRLRNMVGL